MPEEHKRCRPMWHAVASHLGDAVAGDGPRRRSGLAFTLVKRPHADAHAAQEADGVSVGWRRRVRPGMGVEGAGLSMRRCRVTLCERGEKRVP